MTTNHIKYLKNAISCFRVFLFVGLQRFLWYIAPIWQARNAVNSQRTINFPLFVPNPESTIDVEEEKKKNGADGKFRRERERNIHIESPDRMMAYSKCSSYSAGFSYFHLFKWSIYGKSKTMFDCFKWNSNLINSTSLYI